MTTRAVNLTFSFWNDERDFVEKARELSGILVDLGTGKEEVKNIFLRENIVVNEQLLNMAYKIKDGK